jgi:hypothetical protein
VGGPRSAATARWSSCSLNIMSRKGYWTTDG